MTICFGLEFEDKVFLAGDRFAGSLDSQDLSDIPKVYKIKTSGRNKMEVGFAGSGTYRIDHLLKHKLKFPSISEKMTQEKCDDWARNRLCLAMSDTFMDDRAASTKQQDEHGAMLIDDSEILVGFNGRLYVFLSDMAIHRSSRGYFAIGAGAANAQAAWEAVKEIPDMDVYEKIERVMQAVEAVNPLVCGPFDIIEISTIYNK